MNHILSFAALFVLFSIIGRLSHEYGHYVGGTAIGLDCSVHFSYCRCASIEEKKADDYGWELIKAYGSREEVPSELWDELVRQKNAVPVVDRLWVTLGGPLQTMLTGLIGFVILVLRRKYRLKDNFLNWIDWLFVFLSLFWLRQPFNLLHSVVSRLLKGEGSYFGTHGDEVKIAHRLELCEGSIALITATLGVAFCSYVIFRIIPIRY